MSACEHYNRTCISLTGDDTSWHYQYRCGGCGDIAQDTIPKAPEVLAHEANTAPGGDG